MFHRQRKVPLTTQNKSIKDLTRMLPAAQFLGEDRRQALVLKIQKLSGLETARYESLCSVLIENLVDYCQSLPEATNSYYSQPGGLVDRALNRTEAALSLFQEFMIQEKPDSLSEEQKLWQYALFTAAILQGIGKLFVDYQIHLFDTNGHSLKAWNPLLESLVNTGHYYAFEFQAEADIEFRRRLNLLLAKTLMPVSGFGWIASHPQILAVWLALLNEDHRSSGTLGAILIRSDAIAIQRYLIEFIGRGKAKRGRFGTFTGGVPETVTEKEQSAGVEFIKWLSKTLNEGRLMLNKAPLFMVSGGLLLTQEVFLLFVLDHPEYQSWQAVQQGFLSLGLHKRGANGSVMNRFEAPNQQMHNGIVFSKYAVALSETVKVHQMNTGIVETMSATAIVHKALFTSQFTEQPTEIAMPPLHKLSASGHWVNYEPSAPTINPGAQGRV